ncbi:hypothetical protein GOP47_0018882 [Adiantum capillus-veneris]|uniref:Major facilitator superfamily (MFS) profile domain-containing protein n=1 Tax=Adiantum capillus-veneris TaxID=13818 RepID=A0A9D4UEZ8_ADICA|nr:hypothetical protein GOP47_0018882 [Adiantum capillus-veneris]
MEVLEAKKAPAKAGKYVILCTTLATVSSLLLGYDIGVMSGALLFVADDLKLNTIQEEVIVGSLNLVSIFGGAIAGRLSDAIGRRLSMLLASVIFFVGALILAVAPMFGVLLLGRLVEGIGVGFAMMIAPVYSAELAPAHVRGCLVSLTEFFINVGILLGYMISFAFQYLPEHINWRAMLGAGMLPSVVLAVGVVIMPESPRWLVTQRKMMEAKKVLVDTSGGDEEEAHDRMRDIMETVGFVNPDPTREPTANEYQVAFGNVKKQGEGVWKELLLCQGPRYLRRMFICSLFIHFFQQACGIDAAVYYSPVVFGEAGVRSKLGRLGALVGVGVIKCSFVLVATFLFDRMGRKPMVMLSGLGVGLCLFGLGAAFMVLGINSTQGDTLVSVNLSNAVHSSKLGTGITIFLIFAYVGCFSIGMGPFPWVFVAEAFPLRVRAQAMGMCVFMNRLISGTVALTFLTISKKITPAGTFFLYGVLVLMSILFIHFFVPETKGKTLEELSAMFEKSPTKSQSHVAEDKDDDEHNEAERTPSCLLTQCFKS